VQFVCFSPSGERIASASSDKTIKLWNVVSGSLVRTLKGHSQSVLSVCFSPDSKIIASSSSDSTAKLWDSNSGKLIRTLRGTSDYNFDIVNSVSFSPDGKYIVAASYEIDLWEIASGKRIWSVWGHWAPHVLKLYPSNSISFSPDGKKLVSAGGDGNVEIMDVGSGISIRTFKGRCGLDVMSNCAYFSPNGKYIAFTDCADYSITTGSQSRTSGDYSEISKIYIVNLWDSVSGNLIHTFGPHSSKVHSISFSPNGQLIATASYNGIKLWHVETSNLVRTFGE